jgi:leucyl-tRNA synthetase
MLGGKGSVFRSRWPAINRRALARDEIEMPVQVNGRVRDRITVAADTPSAEIERQALALPGVSPHLEGLTVRKVVIVPRRIVNIVAN